MLPNGGFKFNFQLQNDVENVIEAKEANKEQKSNCVAAPACEIFIKPFHHDLVRKYKFTMMEYGDASFQLKYALPEAISEQLDTFKEPNNSHHGVPPVLLKAAISNSDLIPGVYEGGLKIWEGSCDLLDYLYTSKMDLNGVHVLELGCGAGLPGIAALLRGASCVTFQDYNAEVVNLFTIPNVLANITTQLMQSVKFFAGDWCDLATCINPHDDPTLKYDIVLTSETIYCMDSQPKLLELIKRLVKPHTGKAFVAAKSHYFGVGGSMEMFKMLVRSDGFFKCSSCMTITQYSVPREVILLEQV